MGEGAVVLLDPDPLDVGSLKTSVVFRTELGGHRWPSLSCPFPVSDLLWTKRIYAKLLAERRTLELLDSAQVQKNLLYLRQCSWRTSPKAIRAVARRVQEKRLAGFRCTATQGWHLGFWGKSMIWTWIYYWALPQNQSVIPFGSSPENAESHFQSRAHCPPPVHIHQHQHLWYTNCKDVANDDRVIIRASLQITNSVAS